MKKSYHRSSRDQSLDSVRLPRAKAITTGTMGEGCDFYFSTQSSSSIRANNYLISILQCIDDNVDSSHECYVHLTNKAYHLITKPNRENVTFLFAEFSLFFEWDIFERSVSLHLALPLWCRCHWCCHQIPNFDILYATFPTSLELQSPSYCLSNVWNRVWR